MIEISKHPKPNWQPLPRPGCSNVEFRVLLNREGLILANLRFGKNAEIDEHDAPMDIEAIVVSGSGFVSVGGETSAVAAGESVFWPKGKSHKLWTTSTRMETMMVERVHQILPK